jgi:hypothetical protein
MATERDRLAEQSPAQPQRTGRRIDEEPAQLSISPGMADNGDAAGQTPFPFGDPELIAVGPRADEFSQEAGDMGFECRVETTLARVVNPM